MANSLNISGVVTFQAPANSQTVSEQLNLVTALVPAGSSLIKSIGSLTNSATQQVLTGVSTPGAIILRNLDATNTVTYGPNATAQNGTLLPGALNIWTPTGTTLYAATTAGTAQLQIFATSA